jgi:transposase
MAKAKKLTEEAVNYARQQVQTSGDAQAMRKALAVLLPAEIGITQSQTADLLGIGVATVKRYQGEMYRRAQGDDYAPRQWGGRHNETVSLEIEKSFLDSWCERAAQGEAVYVKRMREDLQRRVGRRIPLHTMYRILALHGWRKVAPDTKHPKGDPVAQEAFKKTSAPNWLPPDARIAKG